MKIIPFQLIPITNRGRRLWLLSYLLLTTVVTFGQNEVSVDRFTGTGHVSIPVFSMQSRGISLPLSLDYDASGIKVDAPTSAAGINWDLTGLPLITREVRDLPDDIKLNNGTSLVRYGWLATGQNVPAKLNAVPAPASTNPCSSIEQAALSALYNIKKVYNRGDSKYYTYDSEPDIFTYSIPGHSGKFVFDGQAHIQLIPYDNITLTYTLDVSGHIASFDLVTPEGQRYIFDVADNTTEAIVAQSNTPPFYQRHYQNYSNTDGIIAYSSAWHPSSIRVPQQIGNNAVAQGNVIWFTYHPLSNGAGNQITTQLFWPGTTTPQILYAAQQTVTSKNQLVQISSQTNSIEFSYNNGFDILGGPISSIGINSVVNSQSTRVKNINLTYSIAIPSTDGGRVYYDSNGTPISSDYTKYRRFLNEIRLSNECMTLAAYSFDYQTPNSLPPSTCVEQDYWGYYNGNRASSAVPQLYVYPQLDPTLVPGGPYRLFPASNIAGGLTIPGANRQPAQNLADFQQTTLAGTLTGITLPTGGKITLDYEPHRFYDPVAQAYYNGAGVRVKAIHWKEAINGVEQVRQYQYTQQVNGESSGRLLHVPKLAITNPLSTATGSALAQWTAATVTSLTDLAPDLFETRAVGYSRVVEQVVGRGQSEFTFSLVALPEDAPSSTYLRASTGLARTLVNSNCPATGLFQSGLDVYPFVQATNYEHERGNLLAISQQTEPDAKGVSVVVQRDTYQYGYLPTVTPTQVQGVNYELLMSAQDVSTYAKYTLQTGFIYTLLSQYHQEVDQLRPTQLLTATTTYSYTKQGQLATTLRQNSDGTFVRTRVKYLSDFAAGSAAAGPQLTAIRQRVNTEKITSDPVETVTEIVPPAGSPKVTSVLVNTFTVEDGCTRPYQQFAWQPAQAVATRSAAYDSTRIQSVNGVDELIVNAQARQRPVLTVEAVNQQLTVTDAYAPSGRRRMASLLTADGSLAKLQIQNARLSEVLFSDFESQTIRDFVYSGTPISTDAHTGTYALTLATNQAISHTLPESARNSYRLSLWVKNTAVNGSASLAVKIDGTTVATPSFTSSANWQLLDIPLNVGTISSPRASHTLQLLAGNSMLVDDIRFLPTVANATSLTYDNQYRRTSQTDNNNQTSYYGYDPTGNGSTVSDHNKSITQQVTNVIAGRGPAYSVDFQANGSLYDQTAVSFIASSSCLPGVQYSWTCVDVQTGQTVFTKPTNNSPATTYTFSTNGQTRTYQVTVNAVVQNRQLSTTHTITIQPGPWQVQIDACGAIGYNTCTKSYNYQSCNGGTSATSPTIFFSATIANVGQCGAYTYTWEKAALSSTNSPDNWQPVASGSSSQLSLVAGRQAFRIRCRVDGCNRTGISGEWVYSVNTLGEDGQPCH